MRRWVGAWRRAARRAGICPGTRKPWASPAAPPRPAAHCPAAALLGGMLDFAACLSMRQCSVISVICAAVRAEEYSRCLFRVVMFFYLPAVLLLPLLLRLISLSHHLDMPLVFSTVHFGPTAALRAKVLNIRHFLLVPSPLIPRLPFSLLFSFFFPLFFLFFFSASRRNARRAAARAAGAAGGAGGARPA